VTPMSTDDTLVLTRVWPFGLYKTDTNEDGLLFRPYRRIATTGGPTGTLNYAVIQTDEPLPKPIEKGFWRERVYDRILPWRRGPIHRTIPRLLGSFCYTGRMILFFPGFRGTYLTGFDKHDQRDNRRTDFLTDHFSLEPNFDRWHVTSFRNEYVKGFRTIRLKPNLVFWFGMSVEANTEFEAICRVTSWTFQCPDSDSQRRFDDAFAASRDSQPHIIAAPDSRVDNGSWFWHFEVVLQLGEFASYPATPFHLPYPFATIRSNVRELHVRSHPLRLPGFEGIIFITASRLSGSLSEPIILAHA